MNIFSGYIPVNSCTPSSTLRGGDIANTVSSTSTSTMSLQQQQQQQQPMSIQEKARIEREQRALLRDQTVASVKIQRMINSFISLSLIDLTLI